MKKTAGVLAFALLTTGTALAQAPLPPLVQGEPETVHSEAQREKDEQFSRRFVQSLLRPSTSLEGQFAKWKVPVCPHVYGLSRAAAQVVERRIRAVAAQVGAPLDRTEACAADIGIIFTAQPQATLDSILASRAFLVQGAGSQPVARFPVEAWYASLRTDYSGLKTLEVPREIAEPWRDFIAGQKDGNTLPWSRGNDSRLLTGQTIALGAATVLVDTRAVTGMTLGTLADHVALMTLAQAPATGRCQPAPSIANLFLKDCGAELHTSALSDADLAMLTALYQTPDQPEKLQMMRLIGNMRRNLEGDGK